jgi:ABC-2 type transport system permease protein
MRVYVEVAKRAFRQQLAYRTANLAGLTTNAFWGALRSFLFLGLYQGCEVAAGWSVRDAIDYVWVTQALIMPVYFWNWREIAVTIRTGDVVSDLAKPVDYYAFWLSRDADRAARRPAVRRTPASRRGALGLVLPERGAGRLAQLWATLPLQRCGILVAGSARRRGLGFDHRDFPHSTGFSGSGCYRSSEAS